MVNLRKIHIMPEWFVSRLAECTVKVGHIAQLYTRLLKATSITHEALKTSKKAIA